MKIAGTAGLHYTYCLNIHPGESLDDILSAIRNHSSRVKAAVCPEGSFGLGLRLGAAAAGELAAGRLDEFRDELERSGMYAFTINGFPYGGFHGRRVKESVYKPDWMSDERCVYTRLLISILAGLLPDGVPGSISTVPVSYRRWMRGERDVLLSVGRLMEAVAACIQAYNQTGRTISIAMEPEPDCCLQSASDVVSFFNEYLLIDGVDMLSSMTGMASNRSEEAIRTHLGVCYDTCHAAVQFEDVSAGLRLLADEGIGIPKVQLSSAVSAGVSPQARKELKKFIDPVYLHQVRVRGADGSVVEFPDLDEALLDSLEDGLELRTHFHVPLWFGSGCCIKGTASDMGPDLFSMLRSGVSSHIEVETYTFEVLPDDIRTEDVAENIVREMRWGLAGLQ